MRMDDFYIQEKIIFKVSIDSKKSSFEAEGKKAKNVHSTKKGGRREGAGVRLGGVSTSAPLTFWAGSFSVLCL